MQSRDVQVAGLYATKIQVVFDGYSSWFYCFKQNFSEKKNFLTIALWPVQGLEIFKCPLCNNRLLYCSNTGNRVPDYAMS
jgi:hypothetical protein